MNSTLYPANGTAAGPKTWSPPAIRLVPALGHKIDHLLELRGLIRQAQEAERAETREIVDGLAAAGLTRLAGRQAAAIVDQRTTLAPDPELLLEAVGRAGYAALTVSVTAARHLLAEDDLRAISEITTTPVLRVEAIAPAPAPKPTTVSPSKAGAQGRHFAQGTDRELSGGSDDRIGPRAR